MKSSIFVIAALLGATQAIRPSESMNLQVESMAAERATVRETLKNQLRTALNSFPGPILPGSTPTEPTPSDPIEVQLIAQAEKRTKAREEIAEKLRDYLQIEGENSLIQLGDDEELTVEQAKEAAAKMQAQMDEAVAAADAKRAEQQKQFEENVNKGDPAAQLQGLMNAQESLHRLTSAFSAKPNTEKVEAMAKKLGIPMTPELMNLGSNEAISNALVEIAVGMGKSEEEISAAIGA